MSRINSSRSLTERSCHQKPATHLALFLALFSVASLIQHTSGFTTTSGVPRKLFGGYRITPKQCRATKTLPSTDPRATGPTICMFNHECAQRSGEVVGACMDGFLFGACCQVPKTDQPESTLINDAQNAYYQQYQQHKIQQHESETNKIVSQAYESFAENSAQAQSQSQESVYGSGNVNDVNGVQANDESQQQQDASEQTSNINTDISTENTQTSSSTETDSSGQSSTEAQSNTSREPPKISVHKDSVQISSTTASQSPQNDDFVLQVLNAFPQDEVSNHLAFTTEIPTKIVNSLTEQLSSESDSFEEDHAVATGANRPQPGPPADSDISENTKHHLDNQSQNTDAMYNSVTFSHSDITHPGADAVLVENDLQFSTGYGPEPVFVQAPDQHNETNVGSKNPSSFYDDTTTSSSITTHVDSIETIIQQLNNNSHGPAYNVMNPQTSTFAYEIVNVTNTPVLEYNQDQSTIYNEIEQSEKQTSTPLYGLSSEESSSTNGHYADEVVLEDHTMPENNYNDHQPSAHPTSDFNKMPVMGIAYPVDMSHMEDDASPVAFDYQNAQSSYAANDQEIVKLDSTQIQMNTNTNKPHPMATYIGVVTSQNYGQPQVPKVPHEVVVSSHTTKVEGSLDSSVEYKPVATAAEKITTTIYQPTTTKPVKAPSRPNLITKRPGNKKPIKPSSPNKIATSTSSYSTVPIETKTPLPSESQYISQNYNPSSSSYYHENSHSGSTPKPVTTRKPTKKQTVTPVSTSYLTGPTSPLPVSTMEFNYDNQSPVIVTDDKLDSFVHSTAESLASASSAQEPPLYGTSISITSDTPVPVLRPQPQYNTHKKPGFVKISATQRPPTPTTKPNRPNTASSSYSAIQQTTPTPLSDSASITYLYSPLVTRRPGFGDNAGGDYIGITTVNSNDFDDPGYYGTPDRIKPPQPLPVGITQSSTENVYPLPSDDKPAFPGYYGPTPTYPAFPVPGEKVDIPVEEETYTSPNDFVNFPPVRNPNLNMSASASAVTSDFELSTPAFVEDTILKNKMNTLVHKIVESLQGNFEALADIIDESNNTAPVLTYQASSTAPTVSTVTKRTTRKPTKVTTAKPKATTKKPVTRVSTKAPTKKTATTRKPEVTTKKTVLRRTTTTTRKPATRKPTRKATTTAKTPLEDELVDEEDEEDVNPSDNEINEEDEAQYGAGAGGRKLQCGVRPHIKSGRIVGGKGATFGAYPWQVLVRESTWLGLFTKNKCGGVLITNRYVITAAHCQPGFLASLVAVMGEFDISGDLESKRAVTKNVKRVIVHRQYDPATFENDIALLEMESPVQFDTHIVPICMPSDVADFTGRMATVTGWGRLKYGGGVPSVLQEVQVPVIENSVCQEMFNTGGHNKKILSSFLCAGYATGLKDSCEGDSGGPLVLQRSDGRYELAGTVSHGIKCAAPYLPGVYMRTTFYKPWLRSITGVK